MTAGPHHAQAAANGTGRSSKYSMFGPYRLLRTLGEGEFGKVKLAVHLETSKEVAIKLIKKEQIETHSRRSKLMREISVLQSLDHPYIVKLIEVIETDHYIGMIMEFASGGELFEHIFAHRYLKEKDARRFFAQLIAGVAYIHKQGIVHRDLKLENLLLDGDNNIIISDFGFANLTREDALLQTSCGSPCYAAPELVISDGYVGEAADIWSCGVILYAMLCGYLPFDDDPANPDSDNINLLYKYILETELDFPDFVSQDARQLLQRMLVPDPKYRAKMSEIMDHRWLSSCAYIFEAERERKEEPLPSAVPVAVHPTPPVTPTHSPAAASTTSPTAATEIAAIVPDVVVSDDMDVDEEPVVLNEPEPASNLISPVKPQSITTNDVVHTEISPSAKENQPSVETSSPKLQSVPTSLKSESLPMSPQDIASTISTAVGTNAEVAEIEVKRSLEQTLMDIVTSSEIGGSDDDILKDFTVPSTPMLSSATTAAEIQSPVTSISPTTPTFRPKSLVNDTITVIPPSPVANGASSAASTRRKRSASSRPGSRASERSFIDEDSSSSNQDGKRSSKNSNAVMTWIRKMSNSEETDKTSVAPRASMSAHTSTESTSARSSQSRAQRVDRDADTLSALSPGPRTSKTPTRNGRPVSAYDRTMSTSSDLTKVSMDVPRPSMSPSTYEAYSQLTSMNLRSGSSTARFTYHSGPVDQRALTSRDPAQLIPEIVNILIENGMQVRSTRPEEFKIKVTRPASGDPNAINGIMNVAELERHFSRGMSIDGGAANLTVEDNSAANARPSMDSTRPSGVGGKPPVAKSLRESIREKKRKARGASRLAFIIASLPVSLVKRVKYLAQHGPNWAHGFDGKTSVDDIEAHDEDAVAGTGDDSASVKSGKSAKSNRSGRSRRSMTVKSDRRGVTPSGRRSLTPLTPGSSASQRFEPEIRFNIEIQKIRNLPGLFVVDFKRVRGDIWAFKRLYHGIIDYLPLKDVHPPLPSSPSIVEQLPPAIAV